MTIKERLHQLIEELPESQLSAAERALQEIRTHRPNQLPPVLADAPYDDEAETEEERIAVQRAYEDKAAGRVVPHDEAQRRLFPNK